MALKALMLRRRIDLKKKELEELRTKLAGFAARETELETAIGEVETEEQRTAVEEEITAFEQERDAAQQSADQLESEIAQLESELQETERQQETEPAGAGNEGGADGAEGAAAAEETGAETAAGTSERKVRSKMRKVMRMFGTTQQRDAIFARQDVQEFASRARQLGREKRDVNGGELLIPEIMLPMIREQVEENSKLLKFVNLQSVGGTARENIMGTIPEAVWTEMCANLNKLTLAFNDVEVDGYKVGGFIPVCNALLEDNDVNLVSQILFALARAIAIALDKAILYGTGTKMPMGIVTRLAQTEAPANYPPTARTWADLHTTNIQKITAANSTGIKLFQNILTIFGNAKKKYGAGGKFWAMNETTHTKLMAEALNFNSAGAIVAGMDGTMPVIGGEIVELDFIPDDNIIAGYGELYLLAERAGVSLANSEHFLFTSDKTVFKGTARYDGTPVIAEGFVVIGVNNVTPATTATFAQDTANTTTGGGTTGNGTTGG